jgi:signal transduction histidine kinase
MRLIDKALELAGESSPDRVFDIETRRTLAYLTLGDTANFVKGYKAYKEGVAKGFNSVHGRQLEIQWLASHGQADEAVKLATDAIDNPYETQAEVYAQAGRWKEAFDALKKGTEQSDSINSFILKSSMEGIESELQMYEVRRQQSRVMFYSMVIVISLLLLLIAALIYIVQSRRRHWRQMESAYQHVIEAEKVKTDFIQNVSHEVRTPLNIISGFAQVLASSGNDITPEERNHISETMLHNTRLITTMVNEVLEISRGDALDKEIELKPFQCNELIRRALNYFCTNFFRPQAVLHYESALSDDVVVHSHEVLLQRILNPLLDNAYKNIPAEGGAIVVRVAMTDSQLEIYIEDNGPGIPASEADHVFERFVKLDSFKEGLGLGLTFGRTMARRMGGDVVLDTTFAGPGACFKVTLPLGERS